MGPLRLIPDLPENFLVMNGDILTDLNLAELFRRHREQAHLLTIAVTSRKQSIDYGVIHVCEGSNLARYQEKPGISYTVSMGIYCLRSRGP